MIIIDVISILTPYDCRLTPYDCRDNLEIEGFGKTWDHTIHMDVDDYYTKDNFSGIYGKQAQTALFKPLLGILGQSKYLPLRYCPLTIELELVNNLMEPIITLTPLSTFDLNNTSTIWQIENVQLKCDTCTLDNSLDNSYAQYLLSGKSLGINYNTYISQMQSTISNLNVGQQAIRLNITRALSRLKSVFLTLISPPGATADAVGLMGLKEWNNFYSPMRNRLLSSKNHSDSDGEFEYQIQIGRAHV